MQNGNFGNKASTIKFDVLDKNKRNCNFIVFNMPDTDLFNNDKRNLSQLMYELDLNECIIESISRFGCYSLKKPRPLKLQLASEGCVSCFLDAAKLLK